MSVCNMHNEPQTSTLKKYIYCFIFPGLYSLFLLLSSSKRHLAIDWEAVWGSGDTHGTPFLLHPVFHGQPDPAQTCPAEQRGGPRPSGGQGFCLVTSICFTHFTVSGLRLFLWAAKASWTVLKHNFKYGRMWQFAMCILIFLQPQ